MGEQASEGPRIVLKLIIGVLIFILFAVIFLPTLFNMFLAEEECENEAQWQIISSAINDIDLKEDSALTDFQFVNENCNIVAFSEKDATTDKVRRGEGVLAGARICLCNIDSGKCDAKECQKLTNIKEIKTKTGEQFTTQSAAEFIQIYFKKQGDKLIADTVGNLAKELEFTYKQDVKFETIDKGMIKELKIKVPTTSTSISYGGFIPKVNLETSQFSPAGIPRQGDLPILIDLNLGVTANTQDLSVGEFQESNVEINPETIIFADIKLSLDGSKLPQQQEELNLYYYNRTDNAWHKSKMICGAFGQEEVECQTAIQGFSDKFAISTT
jgi:hypothetical protein